MKLRAVKEGKYGFNLTATLYPSAEKDQSHFVYLDSLELTGGTKKPLVKILVMQGSYALQILKSLEGYEDGVKDFESIFLNTHGIILEVESYYKSFINPENSEGVIISLPEETNLFIYDVLCSILRVSRLNATAYAQVGMEGDTHPVKITVGVETPTES